MITTHIRYKRVEVQASKSGKCRACGKQATRKMRFYQTLNPFNTASSGRPKDRELIMLELKAAKAKWLNEPVLHKGCELHYRGANHD